MNKYFQLLSKVKIHPLLWFVVGIAVITANFRQILILFLIVFIHEMGHAVCAHFFSWRISKIELLPFGGVAEMDEHGNRPLKEEFFVILAGPLQHLWLALLSFILFKLQIISADTFSIFTYHNMAIFLFNLLPIWPLDGGKLLFIFISRKLSFAKAHTYSLWISSVNIILFVILLLIFASFHLHLWIVGSYLMFSIYMEWKQKRFVLMRFLIERYYGKGEEFRELKPIVVNETEKIYNVLLKFQRGHKHPIIIQSHGKETVQLDENEVLHAYFQNKMTTEPIGDLAYFY